MTTPVNQMLGEEEREPTNEEIRVALGKIAFNSTQRSRANTCYAAQERIYELTEALKALHTKTVIGTDAERHDALNGAWEIIAKSEGLV